MLIENKGKKIYISHHQQDLASAEQMKNLLLDNDYIVKTNYIKLKPINQQRFNDGLINDRTIERDLKLKITWADIIIVLIGHDTINKSWINLEIEIAHKLNKRIVGVYLQKSKEVKLPTNLEKYGSAIINWQYDKIIEVIEQDKNLSKNAIYGDIVNKVANGFLKEAIDIYIEFEQFHISSDMADDLFALKDRINRLERVEKLGLNNKSDITIEKNKIANALLSLLNDIQINKNDSTASITENRLRIHISYSHKDELYKEQLEKHLASLKRNKIIEIWSDKEILPGEDWSGDINRSLENADIIIFLISSDFLASDYCYSSEMYNTLEKHKRGELQIIPVLVRDCEWKSSPFSTIQLLPSNNKAINLFNNLDEGYNNVAINLKHIVERRFQQSKEILSNINNLERKLENENSNYEQIEIIEVLIDLYKSINKLEKINELTQIKSNLKFRFNINNPVLIKEIHIEGVSIFNDISWDIQPNINILLGRNGYGKSHLIRLIACILRNEKKIMDIDYKLFDFSLLKIVVNQLNKEKITQYNDCKFIADMGIVPMLAIPAIRNLYPTKAISPVNSEFTGALAEIGAHHFIRQLPFDTLIQDKLFVLGNDLLKQKNSFDGTSQVNIINSPVVKLINKTVKELTNYEFEIVSIKDYHGQSRIDIDVLTEGSKDPIAIQKASQGTISILSILLLIYYYLKSLYPDIEEELLLDQKAIVIIDEVDAHLHPLWQRKIIGILRNNFPKIQFFITAHSPLIVAGCYEREVSVLRKTENDRFSIFQFQEHFVGAEIHDIYRRVFEIENVEVDDTFLNLSVENSYTNEKELFSRIEELENKSTLTERDETELVYLHRLSKVRIVEKSRMDNNLIEKINDLEAKIRSLEENQQK